MQYIFINQGLGRCVKNGFAFLEEQINNLSQTSYRKKKANLNNVGRWSIPILFFISFINELGYKKLNKNYIKNSNIVQIFFPHQSHLWNWHFYLNDI